MTTAIPPMEPIAPLVDQMLVIAREELPAPRMCRVEMFDDGTFTAESIHSMGSDEIQRIRYERTTSEILWEYLETGGRESIELTGGETIHEPNLLNHDISVVATVEPPLQ